MSLIIAGFAGIGKTTLSKKYKNVIDLECSPFRWDYTNVEEKDYESIKGNPNKIPNKDWPNNYINAIKEAQKKYDIITVWLQPEKVFVYYEQNNIEYALCYPSKEAFKDYKERYKTRGNNDQWIEKVTNYFYNKAFEQLSSMSKPQIILNKGETLETYLIKNNYNLIPYNKNEIK